MRKLRTFRQKIQGQNTSPFPLPLPLYETAVPRGEWLDFAPNEDNEVPSDDEKEDGRSSGNSKAGQICE